MYRLSGVEDVVLQQIVSNEIAAGFLKTFGVMKAVNKLEMGEREKGIIKYLLNTYSGNDSLHDLGDIQLEEIAKKISKMYSELIDMDYEYVFDEFGEYLMYIFIKHAQANAFDVRESGYLSIDDVTQENYSEVPLFASSSICIMDELYLRKFFGDLFDEFLGGIGDYDDDEDDDDDDEDNDKDDDEDDIEADVKDEGYDEVDNEIDVEDGEDEEDDFDDYDEEEFRERFIEKMIRQASIFSCMGFEEDSGDSFVFWDDDFLRYDKTGGAAGLYDELAEIKGLIMTRERREPMSGSVKSLMD
ncbi:MAG: hypothetical protein K6G27_02745 [Lachnospiraceae bacterium]|nr:hypothetical protein [Lachnospiraceae bacterium]